MNNNSLKKMVFGQTYYLDDYIDNLYLIFQLAEKKKKKRKKD